jgi:hypothetical protein
MTENDRLQLGFKSNNKISPIAGLTVFYGEILETVNSHVSSTILVQAESPEFIEKNIRSAMDTANPVIYIRLGVNPWQEHHIVELVSDPNGPSLGHEVKLITRDLMWKLQRKPRTTSRKGNISEIVEAIAAEHGLKTSVEQTSKGGAVYIQSFETDYEFVVRRLLPRAVNERGTGNYRFFIKDGVLHFHTPDYLPTVKNYSYYGSGSGFSLSYFDNSQSHILNGAGGVKVVSYDPYDGSIKEFLSAPEKSIKYANSTPQIFGKDLHIYKGIHVGGNRNGEEANISQSSYDVTRNSLFSLLLMSDDLNDLRLNDILNLTILSTENSNSTWSGYYTVNQATHIYEDSISSSFVLNRGEVIKRLSGVSESLSAPGRDINLR